MLAGEDIAADALGNTAANPDRIAPTPTTSSRKSCAHPVHREDSGQHVNNFLWAYNVDTRQLAHQQVDSPRAAKPTGLHAVDEING